MPSIAQVCLKREISATCLPQEFYEKRLQQSKIFIAVAFVVSQVAWMPAICTSDHCWICFWVFERALGKQVSRVVEELHRAEVA